MENDKLKHIKSTGFKTPEGYFDSLEAKLNARLANEGRIQDIDNTGFEVPKDYFETLDGKILSKVSEPPQGKVVTLFSRRNLVYISGVAAAILIAFTIFFKSDPLTDTDIDDEVVKTYILDEGISSYELAALFTEEELSTFNTEIMEEAFNDEPLEDYLFENTDIEDLIE